MFVGIYRQIILPKFSTFRGHCAGASLVVAYLFTNKKKTEMQNKSKEDISV